MDKIEIPMKWHLGEVNDGWLVAKSPTEYYHFSSLAEAFSFIADAEMQSELSFLLQHFKEP